MELSLVEHSNFQGVDLLIPQVGGSARKTNVRVSYMRLDSTLNPLFESMTTPTANFLS
jgi:hypothetical protein